MSWEHEIIRKADPASENWAKETVKQMKTTIEKQAEVIRKAEPFLRYFWWYLLAAMVIGATLDHLVFYR